MAHLPIRCLILACGNSLRGDDGVGPRLATWAEERFRGEAGIRVLCRQQWTPELAEDIAQADSVLFVDASAASSPGAIQIVRIDQEKGIPAESNPGLSTHHLDAGQLLGLCRQVYAREPGNALLLTVGLESTELGGTLSEAVASALPQAEALMERALFRLLRVAGEARQG